MRSPAPLGALVSILLVGTGAVAQSAVDSATFRTLCSLAGDWSVARMDGGLTDLRATYSVVAGGAAVLETMLVGTADETVTMYHVEGEDVTVTQLSARGFPMRLAPVPDGSHGAIRFEVLDRKPTSGNLRAIQLVAKDAENVRVEWTIQADAGPRTQSFELRRDAPIEQLHAEVARLRSSLESLETEVERRMKRDVLVERKGLRPVPMVETRTLPPGPGWAVSGVPFKQTMVDGVIPFASTFSSQGDRGQTVAHFGFRAGKAGRVQFSLLGGHAFVALVEETRAPPPRIKSIEDFVKKFDAGQYGTVVQRVIGNKWKTPRAIEWDISRFDGKLMRLYVVDAVSNHYGQIAISEVRILEEKAK